MFKLASLFSFQKWALVKSYKVISASYTYHIHLYESSNGKRKAEYMRDGRPSRIENARYIEQSDLYKLTIHRWLSGRNDPTIPGYSQIAEEDTANYLKGSI